MKMGIRKTVCILVVLALNAGGLPLTASAVESGVTVTSREEFMDALAQHKSPITVSGLVTIGEEAGEDKRMLPVMIPADTVIRGTENANLISRAPVQLQGDASFENIELTFNSTNALGSVPHREIFLAGHKLIFDNVKTELEGGGSSLGGIGGTETELLPTVYAGGFTDTDIGNNAALTVRNSNDATMFQAIYMAHDEESDHKVPYYGTAELNLDTKVTVRERVDVSRNSRSAINIAGGEYDSAKTKAFYGNENTTLTLSGITIPGAVVDHIGSVVLTDKACLSSMTDSFRNVTLRRGACLDLSGVSDVMVSGDFAGVEDPAEDRGILVVNQQSTLIIEGTVTGTTQFQTKNRYFPGSFTIDWPYISVNRETASRNNFVLSDKSVENGYLLKYLDGNWFAVWASQDDSKKVGSIELTAQPPSQVILDSIAKKEDDSVPDESVYFDIVWKDADGAPMSAGEAGEMGLYEPDYVYVVRTECWESDDPAVLAETDWGNAISLMESPGHPGRYFLQADEGAKTGAYTFLFCSDYCTEPVNTVQDIKNLVGNLIKAERQIVFLDKKPEVPPTPTPTITPTPAATPTIAPTMEPTTVPTDQPVRSESSATQTQSPSPSPTDKVIPVPTMSGGSDKAPVPVIYPPEKVVLSASSMVYTGKARKPGVTVTDTKGQVIDSRYYQLIYRNNVKVGQASVTVRFAGKYSGSIKKFFFISPRGTKLIRLTAKRKGIFVKWKRQSKEITGYEIQYSSNKKFAKKGTKKLVVKNKKKVSKMISRKRRGKKYRVRIRTYKTVKADGRIKKLYSRWSGIKSVTL